MRFQRSIALPILAAATSIVMLGTASPCRAGGVDADVRAGVFPSADAVGVGAGVLTHLGSASDRWYANPNAEIAVNGDHTFSLNGDFHYDVSQQRTTSVWLGGGPAVIVQDHDGSSRSDLGLNVLAGVGKTRGDVRPFGQIKGVVSDNGGVALVGGVRF